jgi:hypothetical protein
MISKVIISGDVPYAIVSVGGVAKDMGSIPLFD